jgi:uncharacterized damage-inducible protein DinB
MPRPSQAAGPLDVRQALIENLAANEAMNQIVLAQLDPAAWRAQPPGSVRTIAAIFSHVQNIRRKWLRLSAPHLGVPRLLARSKCTQKEVKAALAASGKALQHMIAGSIRPDGTPLRTFQRDTWGQSWPAGIAMVHYIVGHEAHHRGQVCLLAHQLGFPLKAAYRMYNWERIWRECGFKRPR